MNSKITFEGQPPFGLEVAQTGSARAVGDDVEMTLYISAPEISPEPVAIQVPMLHSTALSLGDQLRKAAIEAELHAIARRS
jgi:hypothetical protein